MLRFLQIAVAMKPCVLRQAQDEENRVGDPPRGHEERTSPELAEGLSLSKDAPAALQY
jgi:hypothetical protein